MDRGIGILSHGIMLEAVRMQLGPLDSGEGIRYEWMQCPHKILTIIPVKAHLIDAVTRSTP